jgi:hypothetical protein
MVIAKDEIVDHSQLKSVIVPVKICNKSPGFDLLANARELVRRAWPELSQKPICSHAEPAMQTKGFQVAIPVSKTVVLGTGQRRNWRSL